MTLILFLFIIYLPQPLTTHIFSRNYKFSYTNAIKYDLFTNNIYQVIQQSLAEDEIIKSINYGIVTQINTKINDKPNIIMIQIESLDGNIINYMHNGDYIMPYLNQVASNNIYYPYTLVYRYAGGSSDAEISVLNGIEPYVDYPMMTISKDYDYPQSLPKLLGKSRYKTFGFHGNFGKFYNRDYAYRMMGFSKFFSLNDMGLIEKGWGASDEDVFNYVSKMMGPQLDASLFFIVTMTSHHPYKNFENYYNQLEFENVEPLILKRYFRSMSYVDNCLSKFIPSIQSKFRNAYIFIYGDHTPNLSNVSYYKKSIVHFDKMTLEFVPLIIISPDGKQYFENRNVASLLDIKPTVLTLTGSSKTTYSLGNDLLSNYVHDKTVTYNGKYYSREELYQKALNSVKDLQ